MKTSHRWLLYTLLRLGLFVGVFAVLMLLGLWWWASAIFAMLISFTVSYLFFKDTRDALARDLQERRRRGTEDPDAEAENAANDAAGERP
ncbi:DUF4229 domain-containing protein [Salinibacterium sp. SYSU T00001]|uniref:DUF4229 domain-containing protein n=1 Tax=Homoserinimonas sedimenticola TaxID=2986805 RepID=UPI002235A645|nr:DUF4229 domain-containing protein [Salinibacterium sedimenticola]MCW4385965.1 DUF4229 domain-containing protein [Salinibacterium sedimenticola]